MNSVQQKTRKADRALDIKTFVIVALKITLISNYILPYQKKQKGIVGLTSYVPFVEEWKKVE